MPLASSTTAGIADIVVAVDEPLDATNCDRQGNCKDGKPCSTHDLWFGLSERIYEYLQQVNLQQLADGELAKKDEGSPVHMTRGAASATAAA
jgi:Rrf2 family iron-sulfur cluster assembly transcriptional regulator